MENATHPNNELRKPVILEAIKYFNEVFKERTFKPGETYIPPSGKLLDENDLVALIHASLDMWLTSGRFGNELEAILPKYFGKKSKALLVNSGSSANLVAVSALGANTMGDLGFKRLEPGAEIITVAAGFPTTVNPILQNGWTPVFVDVDLDTLNAVPEKIFAAKTSKTRGVVLAHTLGNPYRSDEIAKWCEKEGLFLIEDCCDALGSTIETPQGHVPVGSYGHYATVSFYPAHHITMGEGGAVMAKDGRLRKVAESVRDWGRDCWCEPGKDNTCNKRYGWQIGDMPAGYDHKYIYSNLGYNLKVTDMQAAIGISQLQKVESFIQKRKTNYRSLYEGICKSNIGEKLKPVIATPGTDPSWFGFAINVAKGIDRNSVVQKLEEKKVGTRLLFGGNLAKQKAYSNSNYKIVGNLSNTDEIMSRTFWIGLHPSLGPAHISYMLETLEQVSKNL